MILANVFMADPADIAFYVAAYLLGLGGLPG